MEATPEARRNDLHPLIWLGLPAATLAICWLAPLMGYRRWRAVIHGERGFIENATVAFALLAAVVSALIFLRRRRLPRSALVVVLLGGAAALFFAGEEANWGRHWGLHGVDVTGIEDPKFGLHHHTNVLNNLPRQAMNVLCVAAVVLPLVLRKRLNERAGKVGFWHWVVPTPVVIPAALLAVLCRVPERVYDWLLVDRLGTVPEDSYANMAFLDSVGEVKEYFFAMVMLVYMLSVHARLRPAPPAAEKKPEAPPEEG